ncbi:MAG: 4Fe-4S dicluster domain-containing protein [Coriobacteriia bacterium]
MADIDKTKDTPLAAEGDAKTGVSRREFMTGVGGLGIGAVLGGLLGGAFLLPDEVIAIPASGGYLLVDTKKCSGCTSCMMACSLTHYGKTSLSLARIQVQNNPLEAYPADVTQFQCRQCPYPACVDACPTGAMHADAETGVRLVDPEKCIGCERCVNACPFTPSRVQWNHEGKHAQKCDLCKDTPFWNEDGGADGKQACVEICPMKAIKFTTEIPVQSDTGYNVNLRSRDDWGKLGFPTDDAGVYIAPPSAAGIRGE